MSDSRRFLLVVQQRPAMTGRVGERLERRGFELDIRCPPEGDPLPEGLEGYRGAVVFGGPMSVNDDLPGIHAQLDWLPRAVASNRPLLGICLGAQLLAKALGGDVRQHPEGLTEVGYYPIRPTEAGRALFGGPLYVYHWHREGLRLPVGAERLAQGEHFPNQAYRVGERAYGIQFHPEVTQEVMEEWMERAAEKLKWPGAQDPATQRTGHTRYDAALSVWLDRFLDLWLGPQSPA